MSLQEEAKALLPWVKALAEGKTLQYLLHGGGWYDCSCLSEVMSSGTNCVRIKPEKKLRQYTREEWEKINKVRSKETGNVFAVVLVREADVEMAGLFARPFHRAMEQFTHLDGRPLGVEVDE